MTNKEIFKAIKDINYLVDELAKLPDNSDEAISISETIDFILDTITFNCPRWRYYRAYSIHHSDRTGHYWVTFNS